MRLVSISRGSPRGYFRAFLDWAGFADDTYSNWFPVDFALYHQ
jgi:hypothetical protein